MHAMKPKTVQCVILLIGLEAGRSSYFLSQVIEYIGGYATEYCRLTVTFPMVAVPVSCPAELVIAPPRECLCHCHLCQVAGNTV